jgi:hypothetical protein
MQIEGIKITVHLIKLVQNALYLKPGRLTIDLFKTANRPLTSAQVLTIEDHPYNQGQSQTEDRQGIKEWRLAQVQDL